MSPAIYTSTTRSLSLQSNVGRRRVRVTYTNLWSRKPVPFSQYCQLRMTVSNFSHQPQNLAQQLNSSTPFSFPCSSSRFAGGDPRRRRNKRQTISARPMWVFPRRCIIILKIQRPIMLANQFICQAVDNSFKDLDI